MTDTETSRKGGLRGLKNKLTLVLALCAVLVAVFFIGAFWGGVRTASAAADAQPEPSAEPEPVITGDVLLQQLNGVQELVSMEYHYTNMGRFEDQADFYGWKVPFTTKHFIVSYDGVILAGVRDLSRLQVAINQQARLITVKLPPSEILSHEIFEDSVEVFDESKNIFNHITIEDFTGFTQDQKEEVAQKALDNGLLESADEKARAAVEALLSMVPGMEEYTLTVT